MASFRKRGNGWFVQVNRKGVRRSQTFPTKLLAERWARKVETEILEAHIDGRLSDDRVRLSSLIDRYIQEVRPHRPWGDTKARTLAALRLRLGRLTLRELSAHRVVAYARHRRAQGISTGCCSTSTRPLR